MKNIRKMIVLLVAITLLSVVFTGCSKEKEEKVINYTAKTDIYYMAGDDEDWKYSNQQKEFSGEENCYVRVNSIALTEEKAGIDSEITVIYRFTCKGECNIELSDGRAAMNDNTEDGVFEFSRVIRAQKEKDAEEDFVIFQYDPDGEGSVALEVIYDEQVEERYDQRNTIYFSGISEDRRDGIH